MTKRTKHTLIRSMICCGVALSAGCAAQLGQYGGALRQWGRQAQVYDFDLVRAEAVWSATWLSDAMREARVAREAQLRNMDAGAVDAALPSAWHHTGTTFFVTLFAPRDAGGDLGGVSPLWSLELHDGAGRVLQPAAIESVKPTTLDRKLFPSLTPWSRAYYVRFAGVVQRPARLILRGPTLSSTLEWK